MGFTRGFAGVLGCALLTFTWSVLSATPNGKIVSSNDAGNAVTTHANIDAVSTHAKTMDDVNYALSHPPTNPDKPVIISDDTQKKMLPWPATMIDWLKKILDKNLGAGQLGRFHYEALDRGDSLKSMYSSNLGYDEEEAWPGFSEQTKTALLAIKAKLNETTYKAVLDATLLPTGQNASPNLSVSGGVLMADHAGAPRGPVVLVGFMGTGVLVDNSWARHYDGAIWDGLFPTLRYCNVNFTRVFLVDMWRAAAKSGDVTRTNRGKIPFKKSGTPPQYDLTQWNEAFFDRLDTFVSTAQRYGVVGQITLFDRDGLIVMDQVGRWKTSPYNGKADPNNDNDGCGHCANNINGFLTLPAYFCNDATLKTNINDPLIVKVVDRLKNYHNVIFEVMNEPGNGGFLPNSAQWHKDVADLIAVQPQ